MTDAENRYDRFCSEMTVHATLEEAEQSIAEHQEMMERKRKERAERRAHEVASDSEAPA